MTGVAYGLRWHGPLPAARLLPDDGRWPEVWVEGTDEPAPDGPDHVDADRLRWTLPDGRHTLTVDRASGLARFHGPPIDPESLVHPRIGPVATVAGRWLGRESFHAGALAVDGRAVLVLGQRKAGKSTLLAAAHLAGWPVLADDLCVVEDGQVLAAPRTLDLRQAPSGPLAALAAEPVRGDRWRVALGLVPTAVPLAAWAVLRWGEQEAVDPVPMVERLSLLARWRGWPSLASDPAALLRLAAVPGFVVARPAHWKDLSACVEVVAHLAGNH